MSLPQRKSPRLAGYDYTQMGIYFVTICTHQRLHLFGDVVDGEMRLNRTGQIAADCWEAIPGHFPHIALDVFVVMPNHVHGIVIIQDQPVGTWHAMSDPQPSQFSQPVAGSLSTIIGAYKAAVSKQVRQVVPSLSLPLWQGRFHDHIIRNEKALSKIQEYVMNNPALWEQDVFYKSDQSV